MEGITLAPQILFHIGSLPISNSFLWAVVLSLFIMIVTLTIRFSLKAVPGRLQNAFEILLEGAYTLVQSVMGDDKKAKKVFPLVFTLFIFIFMANMATFIPGQSAFTVKTAGGTASLFRAVIADYSLVFIMTMISVITTQIVAIVAFGPFGYIFKFINIIELKNFFLELLKGKLKIGMLGKGFLDMFLGLMDVVGELAKVISLSFRLFGNMFAGEVLGAVFLFLCPFLLPLPMQFMGLLTAVVQAFVFSILTLIFIKMAGTTGEEPAEQNS